MLREPLSKEASPSVKLLLDEMEPSSPSRSTDEIGHVIVAQQNTNSSSFNLETSDLDVFYALFCTLTSVIKLA